MRHFYGAAEMNERTMYSLNRISRWYEPKFPEMASTDHKSLNFSIGKCFGAGFLFKPFLYCKKTNVLHGVTR